MTNKTILDKSCDVAIIGGGPAGLSTAIELKKLGVENVIVLERFSEAGGNPRHCGHSPFGMREFKRVYFGPKYAKSLVKSALKSGVKIALNTTVTSFEKGGLLTLSTKHGITSLHAKKVVLSTGIREKPRSARLVSGQRPLGIMTAGALQSMVYLGNNKPFEKPVIIGSELVSFSSVATCHHAKIKPVAMIEENTRATAWSFLSLYPRLLGVKFLSRTRLLEIHGKKRVTGVTVLNSSGKHEDIDCDGVIFSGQFTPEASLAYLGHLDIDSQTGGPVVDQFGRCSDPDYFASGNVLRPVETAGWCWKEGVETARNIAGFFFEKSNKKHSSVEPKVYPESVEVEHTPPLLHDVSRVEQISIKIASPIIKYCVPQRISLEKSEEAIELQIRVTKPAKGRLVISSKSGVELWSKNINALPERRILLSLSKADVSLICDSAENIVIGFEA